MNISQNIVIKKSVKKGNSYITECQEMYRKSSFAIVGCELQEFLDEELRNDYSMQQSPKELTEKLHKMFNNYVIEDEICLHNDIEYLVIINMNKKYVKCYKVCSFLAKENDEESLVIFNEESFVCNRRYTLIYKQPFDTYNADMRLNPRKDCIVTEICNSLIQNYVDSTEMAINVLMEILLAHDNHIPLLELSQNGEPETEIVKEDENGNLVVDYIYELCVSDNQLCVILESDIGHLHPIYDFPNYQEIVKSAVRFLYLFLGNYIC